MDEQGEVLDRVVEAEAAFAVGFAEALGRFFVELFGWASLSKPLFGGSAAEPAASETPAAPHWFCDPFAGGATLFCRRTVSRSSCTASRMDESTCSGRGLSDRVSEHWLEELRARGDVADHGSDDAGAGVRERALKFREEGLRLL